MVGGHYSYARVPLCGAAADDFLGTQEDPWDTQGDMLCALIGALTAQFTLTRVHDREIARLEGVPPPSGQV